MKQFCLIGASDEGDKQKALEQFLLEAGNRMLSRDEKHIVIISWNDLEKTGISLNYFNMAFTDFLIAAGHLQQKATDTAIVNNLGRYRSMEVDDEGYGIDEDFENYS